MIQLEEKARWLRPNARSLPKGATNPPKKASSVRRRPISRIVRDYKAAVDKLEEVEAELYQWLTAPPAEASLQEPDPLKSDTRAEARAGSSEARVGSVKHPDLDDLVEVDVVG